MEHRFEGRVLSDTVFGDDDGSAPPSLVAALDAAAAGQGELALVSALDAVRVLVPVVATLDGTGTTEDGLQHDKGTEMSVVTVRAPNGRLGLPAFTSTAALAAWHAQARPVPVPGRRAALAAYDEGADALLLDPAGPVPYVLEGPALLALAEGRPLLPPHEDPDVLAAVESAVTTAGLRPKDVRLRAGADSDLTVVLEADPTADGLSDRVGALSRLLADDLVLRARLPRGLDLEVVAAGAVGDTPEPGVRGGPAG